MMQNAANLMLSFVLSSYGLPANIQSSMQSWNTSNASMLSLSLLPRSLRIHPKDTCFLPIRDFWGKSKRKKSISEHPEADSIEQKKHLPARGRVVMATLLQIHK